MKYKLTLTVGLPASGKSTWAKQELERDNDTVIITKDDLRLFFAYTGNREKKVLKLRNLLTREYLKESNVIWADTNLNPVHGETAEIICQETGSKLEFKPMLTSLEDCIKRDNARANGVGEKVIKDMYYKYIHEDFIKPHSNSQEKAIIVDIDGTLAHGIGTTRKPYEWDKVLTDTVDENIKQIVNMEYDSGTHIFIVSGRDDICQEDTKQWLKDNEIKYHEIYMRPNEDKRDDTEIKKEIYESFISKWNVKYALDDRPRVVRLWRSLGLKVLNVNGTTDYEF
jgi:predicted kinase